jgi:hypothetical protein
MSGEGDFRTQDVIQVPTGASQERVNGILRWVMPPLTNLYTERLKVLQPLREGMQRNPPMHSNSRSIRVDNRPSTAEPIRRASVSELIWTNHFLQPPNPLDNETESVVSEDSFVSNGLEKSKVVQEMTSEELDDKNIEKIRQNAKMAGIGLFNFC